MNRSRLLVPIMLLGMLILRGCTLPMETKSTLEQRQRESVAGIASSNAERTLHLEPADLEITFKDKGGATVTVKQPIQQWSRTHADNHAQENSDQSAWGSFLNQSNLPLVIEWAIGILCVLAILAIIWYIRKNPAVKHITDTAVQVLDDAIHRTRSQAITSTDPSETAKLSTMAADMERDKVKLTQSKK